MLNQKIDKDMVRLTLEELKRRVDKLYETLGGQHPVVFISETETGKRSYLKMTKAVYDIERPDIDCRIELQELNINDALTNMRNNRN